MKALAIVASVVFASFSSASGYDIQLQKIKARSTQLSNKLSRWGIKDYNSTNTDMVEDSQSKTVVFDLHSELKSKRAVDGDFVFGKLVNRLVVSGEEHPVIIELLDSQGFFSRLRLKGRARQSSNPDRVQIEFSKLTLSSGKSVQITASALDRDGALGVQASVYSAKAWALAGGMAGSFVSGLAAASQTQSTNGMGFATVQPSRRNILLQGVAQTAADGSRQLIEESTREKPVLVVEAGTEISIIFNEDLRL